VTTQPDGGVDTLDETALTASVALPERTLTRLATSPDAHARVSSPNSATESSRPYTARALVPASSSVRSRRVRKPLR
jgi:hypothetical protein